MPEHDEKIFGEIYEIYNKYRWKQLSKEDLILLTSELGTFAEKYNWKENPLAFHLADAMISVFDDLYRNGKVPKIPDYIGRSDL